MRKMNKKNAILACLSLSLAMGAVGVASLSNETVSANATFKMEKGASLYLDDVSGLKFSFTDSEYDAQNPATYGMLIVPFDYLAAVGIEDIETETDFIGKLNQAKVDGLIENAPIVKEVLPDEDGVFSHSVGSLYNYNYVREFFGIGYKEVSEGVYEYAQPADGYTRADNVRSVFEVANLALNYHVYDNGDLNGDGNVDAEETEEKEKIDANKTGVENFVTTGFEFVYGEEAEIAVSVAATCVDGEEVTPVVTMPEKQKNIELDMHVRYVLAENDTVAEMTSEGKVKALTRGQSTLTAGIGGVVSAETKTAVLKDETELAIYNTSVGVDFFDTTVTTDKEGYYTASFKGGYWNGTAETDDFEDPGYFAIKNPNDPDGKWTLDKNGTYIDFYFTGNNMPNVEFFGTAIENLSFGKRVDSSAEGNKPSGYVATNGVAKHNLYENWNVIKKYNLNIDTIYNGFNTDGETFYCNDNHKYAGISATQNLFKYGMTDCDAGSADNCFSRSKAALNSTSSGKNFTRAEDESLGTLSLKVASGGSWTDGTVARASKFSMYSLMNAGETQRWHYVVGMYYNTSKSRPMFEASLYMVDENGNDVDADTTTTEIDPVASCSNSATDFAALAEGVTRTGYIIVYGALKGSQEGAGENYRTKLAYTMPYAGA